MSFLKNRMKQYSVSAKEKYVNPIELFYKELIQEKGYNFLRDTQTSFLQEWDERRHERDIVGISDTGAGKTLIGLLMLYSKLKEGVGPVVYLCADNQLAEQVCQQALLYGIPTCQIYKNEYGKSEFPLEFLNSEAVLVATFEKVFNGESVFGVIGSGTRDIQEIGALVVDDAHECIKKAKAQSTITCLKDNNPNLYNSFYKLFEDSIKQQGLGAYNSINLGDGSVVKQVPYWVWSDKLEDVQRILIENNTITNSEVFFTFDLIIDILEICECYISGTQIEITPLLLPIMKIPSFNEAKHRYFLSATLNNAYDLIKEFNVDIASIRNPIKSNNLNQGERLIFSPKRYHKDILDTEVRDLCLEYSSQYNVVVIVPSKERANMWIEKGGVLVDKTNISQIVNHLKTSEGSGLYVFLNRYEGIDLIDNMCRILVLDGMPTKESLKEILEAQYRKQSLLVNLKKAQTIEQGLGRAVRSGTDHCVAFLIGNDLNKFVGMNKNRELFNSIIQGQLNFGLEIIGDENPTKEEVFNNIRSAIKDCLSADEEWRHFHKDLVNESYEKYALNSYQSFLEMSHLERTIILSALRKDLAAITDGMGNILKSIEGTDDEGWYNQLYAHLINKLDGNRSQDLQIRAYDINNSLLRPISFVKGRKVKKTTNQVAEFKQRMTLMEKGMDLCIEIDNIVGNLNYSSDQYYKNFETAVYKLGEFLGFSSSQPDNNFDDGPDNLWRTENFDFVIECKNNSENNISRDESNQMTNSINWYKEIYKNEERLVPLMFHKSNHLEYNAHANGSFKVITLEKLEQLKSNLKKLGEELSSKAPNIWGADELEMILNRYFLTEKTFVQYYFKALKN